MNLLDVLSEPHDDSTRFITARVEAIPPAPPTAVSLVVGELGAPENVIRVASAGYLDSYTPVIGDVVCVLIRRGVGALVLGRLAGS